MESSDDSFVWTDASSANTESDDDSSTKVSMKDKHYESESGSHYKKKLHKKLFKTKTESEVKHELLNGDGVKHETESDHPAPSPSPSPSPLKHKRKRERSTDYLDACVKREHHMQTSDSQDEPPKKKKSKKKKERKESIETIIEDKFSAEKTIVETRPEKNTSTNMDLDCHKKERKESVDTIIEDKFSAEETIVETRPEKNTSTNMDLDCHKKERKKNVDIIIEDKFSAEETIVETRPEKNTSTNMDLDCHNEPIETISKKEKKKKQKKIRDSIKCNLENDNNSVLEVSQNNDISEIVIQESYENDNDNSELNVLIKSKNLNTSKTTKMSDRIQFEDGEDVIAACNEATENTVSAHSMKLRRFIKANPHLHSLTCTSDTGDPLISQDDAIWLLNCPHEMNISSLKDTSVSLDNKCKIKIDSLTFIGNMECELNRAAVLTIEHDRPVIKSLVINGIVNFRKRIAKAHYLDDNIITNNQTDFIPLPETKFRHPLFGPDYKNAIKIPASVKLRLEKPSEPLKEKKKKKKRKHEEMEISVDVADGCVEEAGGERRDRKRRRRSETEPDQPVKKKAKRIKQEQDSTKTWDSEKAIEENLFNY